MADTTPPDILGPQTSNIFQITGTVTPRDGVVRGGIPIHIYTSWEEYITQTTTNDNGEFSVEFEQTYSLEVGFNIEIGDDIESYETYGGENIAKTIYVTVIDVRYDVSPSDSSKGFLIMYCDKVPHNNQIPNGWVRDESDSTILIKQSLEPLSNFKSRRTVSIEDYNGDSYVNHKKTDYEGISWEGIPRYIRD